MSRAATIEQAYTEAVGEAGRLWDRTCRDGQPDAAAATSIVAPLATEFSGAEGLELTLVSPPDAEAALVSHMVRVTVLTLAVTTALGVRGPLRLAFGVAALLHDIGKARLPPDVLSSPTPEARLRARRHVWDGEQMLRATPGLSGLPAVVAFEHHLREDMSGYPSDIPPRRLNACTSIVSIADMFDALRTGRAGGDALTPTQALALMQTERRSQFHQPLLLRFAALEGLTRAGNL